MEKYQIIDQPTIIRDNPNLKNQFNNKRDRIATTNPSSNNTYQDEGISRIKQSPRPRLIHPSNTFINPENKAKSIY